MPDLADTANDLVQHQITESLKNIDVKNGTHTGACLNCGEKVWPPHRWCDNECRYDWERFGSGV